MNSTVERELDQKRYAKLLAKTTPRVITTEQENEGVLAVIQSFDGEGEGNTSPEKVELLTGLVEAFESNPTISGRPRVQKPRFGALR